MTVNRSARWTRNLFFVLALMPLAAGCGQKSERPSSYPASVFGTIELDGQRLDSGTVTFIPLASEEEGGRPGIAKIGPDGSYQVGNAHHDKPTGLKPGDYRVTVLAMQPDPTGNGLPIAALLSPEMYATERSSPFEVHVKPGANRLDLPLRSASALGVDASNRHKTR